MDIRKLVAPVLAIALLAAVGGGVWYSNARLDQDKVAAVSAQQVRDRQVSLRGLIGSEKEEIGRAHV